MDQVSVDSMNVTNKEGVPKEHYDALSQAAAEGDLDRVPFVLSQILTRLPPLHDPNFHDGWSGGQAIIEAIHAEQVDCVKKLFPFCQPWQAQAALRTAAEFGRIHSLRTLLALGVDPKKRNGRGDDALALAAYKGGLECVQELLTWCPVDAQDNEGATPLMQAAAANDWASVQCLLPLSNPEIVDADGASPLSYAAGRNAIHCIPLLLSVFDPLKPDDEGNSPLSYAAQVGSLGVLRLLIEWVVNDAGLLMDAQRMAGVGSEPGTGIQQERTAIQQEVFKAIKCAEFQKEWSCVDLLAPYAFEQDIELVFATIGPTCMPQWAARQERKLLHNAVQRMDGHSKTPAEAINPQKRGISRRL